jgi:hypothetical protein
VTIPTVTHYEDVDFELEIEDLTNIQSVSDVASIFMEVDQCLMLLWVLLFDEPAVKCELILSDNTDIFVYHVTFSRVPISFRVVFRVSESLIRRIRNVQHPVLHEVDHE